MYIIYHKSVTMYMHIVYIQYTLCEVLNEVPTVFPKRGTLSISVLAFLSLLFFPDENVTELDKT